MLGIKGFRLRKDVRQLRTSAGAEVSAQQRNQTAKDSVLTRVAKLGERFHLMSEREYGDWLDALPAAEFTEYVALASKHADPSSRRLKLTVA